MKLCADHATREAVESQDCPLCKLETLQAEYGDAAAEIVRLTLRLDAEQRKVLNLQCALQGERDAASRSVALWQRDDGSWQADYGDHHGLGPTKEDALIRLAHRLAVVETSKSDTSPIVSGETADQHTQAELQRRLDQYHRLAKALIEELRKHPSSYPMTVNASALLSRWKKDGPVVERRVTLIDEQPDMYRCVCGETFSAGHKMAVSWICPHCNQRVDLPLS